LAIEFYKGTCEIHIEPIVSFNANSDCFCHLLSKEEQEPVIFKATVATEMSKSTFSFNFETAKWTLLPARPFPGSHHAAAAVHQHMFLFGGFSAESGSKIQVLDSTANKWSVRPDTENIPYGIKLGSVVAVVLNQEVYVCGGLEEAPGLQGSVPDCATYTPPTPVAAGVWRDVAPMLVGVNHAAGGTNGVNIYVFGGRTNKFNMPDDGIRDLQIYNPTTDSWKYGTPLPFGRSGMGAAAFLYGKLYIFGGEEFTRTFSSTAGVFANTHVYDIATRDWEEGPSMTNGVHGSYPIVDSTEGKVYLVGGGDVWGDSATSMFQTFAIDSNVDDRTVSDLVACSILRTPAASTVLSCNGGGLIAEGVFAAKGNAIGGRCGSYAVDAEVIDGWSIDVSEIVARICMGKSECSLAATDFGDLEWDGAIAIEVKCVNPQAPTKFSKVGAGCCRTGTGSSGDYTIHKDMTMDECKTLCTETEKSSIDEQGCVGIEYSEKSGTCEIHRTPLFKIAGCKNVICLALESLAADYISDEVYGKPADFNSCTAATVPVLDRKAGLLTNAPPFGFIASVGDVPSHNGD
jgi:hypothetical protein